MCEKKLHEISQVSKVCQRTPELLLCLILAKIKFFVIRATIFLSKYQMTALMLEAILTKKVFF